MAKTEIIIDSEYKIPRVSVHEREYANFEARIAVSLVERWGMVAAEADGEDSGGRAKLRRMTSDEIVDHACKTAAGLAAKFRALGWMIELPSLIDHVATAKAAEEKKEEERRRARAQ